MELFDWTSVVKMICSAFPNTSSAVGGVWCMWRFSTKGAPHSAMPQKKAAQDPESGMYAKVTNCYDRS